MCRMFQGESAVFLENVPWVKLRRYNEKHPYPKLNGYGDIGERNLKNESCYIFIGYQIHIRTKRNF